jgi:4-alpha-glucanotransferase
VKLFFQDRQLNFKPFCHKLQALLQALKALRFDFLCDFLSFAHKEKKKNAAFNFSTQTTVYKEARNTLFTEEKRTQCTFTTEHTLTANLP